MRIVFLGTPDFAEASLKKLIDAGKNIVGVFTQPDKPKGRGMQLVSSPVKILAQENNIPVYQPETFRDGKGTETLKSLSPDLVVVVAYGKILPQTFLDVPAKGCINLHGSLLPQYRGAAPIQWAVLNGDKITGVSIQKMVYEMDAGDVIASRTTEIGEFETSGELFDRLKEIGADLLLETVNQLEVNDLPGEPQDPSKVSFTKMLDKSMSPISWEQAPRQIIKQVYGLNPWPMATADLHGDIVKVYSVEYSDIKTKLSPGKIVQTNKKGILMSCKDGETVLLTKIQPAGKKPMEASAYLLGHPLTCDE